jgi:CRP-like cAMP-binding protein
MTTDAIALLRNMPVFDRISDAALAVVLSEARTISVPAGDHFFLQGDEALYMYVLVAGEASVRKSWSDRELEVGLLLKGDCFGEVALISTSGRSATVRAVTDCRAIEISPLNLQRLRERDVDQFIEIQMNLSRELCRRLLLSDASRMLVTEPHPRTDEDGLSWPVLS